MEDEPSPKDEGILHQIDEALLEYDHQRALEEDNWRDLQIFVEVGEMTDEQAQARHIAWLRSHQP